MKVLIIPSWYPYSGLPYAGIFTVNQAKALSLTHTAELSILNWGQLKYQLAIRHPVESAKKLLAYLVQSPEVYLQDESLIEHTVKHLTWTHHILRGNVDHLLPKLQDLPAFDLIHAHVAFPAGYIAMKLAEIRKVPFIITEHSGPFPLPGLSRGNLVSDLVKQPIRKASTVIAVSSALADDILHKTGILPQIIPNLVDTNFYKPSAKLFANPRFSMFALSTLTESKGIGDLLEAMLIVKKQNLDFVLNLAGSGPLSTMLRRAIKSYGLEHNFTLLGQLKSEQALPYYQNCDCFVMPSRIESFSIVLLEAMACGKPLIATACGGPADIVNVSCGMLVPPADPMALAQAIISMADRFHIFSPHTIRNRCIELFSFEAVSKQIGHIYNSLC